MSCSVLLSPERIVQPGETERYSSAREPLTREVRRRHAQPHVRGQPAEPGAAAAHLDCRGDQARPGALLGARKYGLGCGSGAGAISARG